MSFNPTILKDALRSRALTYEDLSRRLGFEAADLHAQLKRENGPPAGLLNKIATQLSLPAYVFYLDEQPSIEPPIVDFRSNDPRPSAKERQTLASIAFARRIQALAAEIRADGVRQLPKLSPKERENLDEDALNARSFFNIDLESQASSKSTKNFYVFCRQKIEAKGIFVFHDSFDDRDGSGFCIADPKYPVIVINTKKQNAGRRLFTLIHELAHVLIGATGISDPFVRKNETERYCNRFAGNFLVPRKYARNLLSGLKISRQPSLDEVARISRRLKISQQATVLRLEQLGLVDSGSYDKWKAEIEVIGNPDFSDTGGGSGGPPPQEKVKLAKFGFRFGLLFGKAAREGEVTPLHIFRIAGIKPKYQRPYFDFAKEAAGLGVADLGVADD